MLAQIAVEDGQGDEDVAKVLKNYLPYANSKERQRILGIINDM